MVKQGNAKGFTMIELMLGLAVFFILIGVGVPSYINYVRNAELSNTTAALFADIYYTRSEAIKRKTNITICRSADASASSPVCGGTANIWTTGWLIFIDSNSNNTYQSADEELLKIGRPPSSNIQVKTNSLANAYIVYNTDGSLNVNNATSIFGICDDRDGDGNYNEDTSRRISIGAIGRPVISVGALTDCDNPS